MHDRLEDVQRIRPRNMRPTSSRSTGTSASATWSNLAQQNPASFTHFAERGDGLVTLAMKTRHLPHRYLIGLQGFRLAQYLQLGWACSDVAYRQAIFCEPLGVTHADDEHIITMSPSGRILGYVSLATNGDGESRDLFDPERAAFPVEEAHGINIFDRVAPLAGVGTHEVRELKRFVHSRTLTDRTQRLRVTLELLHGLGQAVAAASPAVRTLIGDVEEHVALRHLLMAGLEVQLVEGTAPQLTDRDLLRARVHRAGERQAVRLAPARRGVRRPAGDDARGDAGLAGPLPGHHRHVGLPPRPALPRGAVSVVPREARTGRTAAIIAAVVAVVALAVSGGLYLASRNTTPEDCASGRTALRVTASPDIAPVVATVAQRMTTEPQVCVDVTVTAEAPAAVLAQLQGGAIQPPDVWIPNSTLWLTRAKDDKVATATDAPAIATSPLVLAVSAAEAGRPQRQDPPDRRRPRQRGLGHPAGHRRDRLRAARSRAGRRDPRPARRHVRPGPTAAAP